MLSIAASLHIKSAQPTNPEGQNNSTINSDLDRNKNCFKISSFSESQKLSPFRNPYLLTCWLFAITMKDQKKCLLFNEKALLSPTALSGTFIADGRCKSLNPSSSYLNYLMDVLVKQAAHVLE
jgi:hypothetical protein